MLTPLEALILHHHLLSLCLTLLYRLLSSLTTGKGTDPLFHGGRKILSGIRRPKGMNESHNATRSVFSSSKEGSGVVLFSLWVWSNRIGPFNIKFSAFGLSPFEMWKSRQGLGAYALTPRTWKGTERRPGTASRGPDALHLLITALIFLLSFRPHTFTPYSSTSGSYPRHVDTGTSITIFSAPH